MSIETRSNVLLDCTAARISQGLQAKGETKVTQKNSTVWILDDDRSIRWVLEKSLDKSGLATESFDNGDDLLHRLEQVQSRQCIT